MLASLVLVAAALAPRQAPSIERQPIPATVFVEP
jgi:hypothetical protein